MQHTLILTCTLYFINKKLHISLRCRLMFCYTMLYYTMLYYTMLYYTMLHYTMLYYTMQLMVLLRKLPDLTIKVNSVDGYTHSSVRPSVQVNYLNY